MRPCSGSCDELDPPTDSCQQDLTLNADTEVLITFRYGQPCAITTRDSDETAPPIEDNMLSAHPCPNSSRKSVDLDIPGPGQPTPQLPVAPYALGSADTHQRGERHRHSPRIGGLRRTDASLQSSPNAKTAGGQIPTSNARAEAPRREHRLVPLPVVWP